MAKFGLSFITSSNEGEDGAPDGAWPMIVGTAISAGLAMLIAIPVSIGSAVFLVRLAPKWLSAPASFLIELLAAIPSITYGLWGATVMGPAFDDYIFVFLIKLHWFQQGVDMAHRPIYFPGHLFKTGEPGQSVVLAAVILAVMVVPIITAVTRDVLLSVPKDLEQSAYGLGATWWQATRVVLGFAKGGIFGAVILGLARAIGETMAVTMVVAGNWNTMTTVIAVKYEAARDMKLSDLTYIALILMTLTILMNTVARMFIVRTTTRFKR